MTEPFQFDTAGVTVPSGAIDAFLQASAPPPELDSWKARTLLALISLVAHQGEALPVSIVGFLRSGVLGWLGSFIEILVATTSSPRTVGAAGGLVILALPAEQVDSIAAQQLFADCATADGPDAIFLMDTTPSQTADVTQSYASSCRALSAAGYVQLHDSYFGAWMRARAPDLRQHAQAEAQGVPADVQARMMFVIGHARSGTSALLDQLNYCPDVLLLFESNSFLPRMRRRFAENFSATTATKREVLRKGYYCAPPSCGADHPFTVFPALLANYRMVGEKIALAPRRDAFERCPALACFGYYATYFPFAKYVFLAREPFETSEAVLRILPEADPAEILRFIAAYMAQMLQFQSILPCCRVLFMEDFDHLNSAALNEFLGLDALKPNFTFSLDARTTRQSRPAARWEAFDHELTNLHGLYRRTRAMFSTNGYTLRSDVKWPNFEAVVAGWKIADAELSERAFG